MSRHSVADAKNHLPKLIDRALAGEEITITRRGHPVVRLIAATEVRGTILDAEWIKRNRVIPESVSELSAADLIRKMRDEGY